MARELNAKDREILLKLVPEMEDLYKKGVDMDYMNILPPVANHHSRDVEDFERRLRVLSVEDMQYLAALVLQGTESTGCLYPEFAEAFFTVSGEKLSGEVAKQLREAYKEEGSCG